MASGLIISGVQRGWYVSLTSTVSTFGTAVDITLAELAIEAFLPADEATSAYLLNATSPSSSSRAG